MVDAADPEKIEASKNELHNLLDKPQLQGIPVSRGEIGIMCCGCFGVSAIMTVSVCPQVLVLGNKRDLPGALDEKELIERM